MYVELLKAMFIALKKTALLRSAVVKPTHIMVYSVILPCSLVHEDSYFGENCRHPVPPQCRFPCTRLHGIITIITHTTTVCAIKAVKIMSYKQYLYTTYTIMVPMNPH